MADVVKLEPRKKTTASDHNKMLIDRVRGAPAQPASAETDLQNPNVK